MSFAYLLEKIKAADFSTHPFRHIQINNFFSDEHFRAIVSAQDIALPAQASDEKLFDALYDHGYKIIEFPGCITDKNAYLKWRANRDRDGGHVPTSCEGFGIVVRLIESKSTIITDLMAFMNSSDFQLALAEKYEISHAECWYDAGIQKYMDGYEISPHPDIRRKALTYMVNINPGDKSEQAEHHTHYLTFKKERKYVQSFWEGNEKVDRCWVPWDWCDTQKVQTENNSIVIFSPHNESLHAVKAKYDHLQHQRTQLYGNLWYSEVAATKTTSWEKFVIGSAAPESILDRAKGYIARRLSKADQTVHKRFN
jgi:hypothetical protein